MASNKIIFLAVATILLPSATMATEYIVGGDEKWTKGGNYTAWASDKTFYVGDVLVFKYDPKHHSVMKVDAEGFNFCNKTGEALKTGNDIIALTNPGKKWYICGVSDHCSTYGQKLVIDVLATGPSPAPKSDAARGIIASSWYQIIVMVVVALLGLVMM